MEFLRVDDPIVLAERAENNEILCLKQQGNYIDNEQFSVKKIIEKYTPN
jgi:hypothetical protein